MQLEHLVYVSRITVAEALPVALSSILEQSRRHNPANNITGVLAFTETHFVQVLEGSHSSPDVLLLKLLLDERHTGMDVLDRRSLHQRAFGTWSMISPRTTPLGQRRLTRMLADDVRSAPVFASLLAALCSEQIGAA